MNEPKTKKKPFVSPSLSSRSLVVAAGLGGTIGVGCGDVPAPTEPDQVLETTDELGRAGSGVLELQPWGNDGFQAVSSTVDEYIRVGQSLKVRAPVWYLWDQLNPGTQLPSDATLRTLKVQARVFFFDGTSAAADRAVTLSRFSGSEYAMVVESGAFTVRTRTDALRFTLEVSDATGRKVVLGAAPDHLPGPWVFGGDLPNRTLMFDNYYGALRDRVLELGSIRKGSNLTLGFSDWRADQVVARSTLDTQIGTARFYGRFGPTVGPIHGKLVYEVLVGRKLDEGSGWQAETVLAANTSSKLLPTGRTAYELVIPVPRTASQLEVYYHVRAWLEVSYAGYEVVNAWYPDGARLLKADTYDNPSGPGTNYTFRIQ